MNKKNMAVIFCGSNIEDYTYLRTRDFNGYIICADGGLRHANELNLVPDIVIGDRDSWEWEYPETAEVDIYPPEKDFGDTHLCIDKAIELGCREIELIGALGGRHDHEFSHYCMLAYGLSRDVRIKITDEQNEIWMEDKPFTVAKSDKKYLSFFPYGGEVKGFSLSGVKYPLKNACLSCESDLTISNEILDMADVSFESGRVLVMLCSDERKR